MSKGERMKNYEEWLLQFGNRVRLERKKQNLTRPDLADLAHTEQGYIVQIERGSRSPSLKTFMNLLHGLGVSADYLLFGNSRSNDDEKEGLIQDFINLIKRGDVEDIKILYQIITYIQRYKNQQYRN